MEQKSTTKEVDKSQEIARYRKSISETTVLLREKIQLLTVLFNKLTISEKIQAHRRRTYGSIRKFNENDS